MESKWRLNVFLQGWSYWNVTLAARRLNTPFRTYIVQAEADGVKYRGQSSPAVLPEFVDVVTIVGPEIAPFPYGFDVEPDR